MFLVQTEEAPALGWEGLSWSSEFLLAACVGVWELWAELFLTVCLEREFSFSYEEYRNKTGKELVLDVCCKG